MVVHWRTRLRVYLQRALQAVLLLERKQLPFGTKDVRVADVDLYLEPGKATMTVKFDLLGSEEEEDAPRT